jgi:uncharacterized protein YoaH (UPF0181 family)
VIKGVERIVKLIATGIRTVNNVATTSIVLVGQLDFFD